MGRRVRRSGTDRHPPESRHSMAQGAGRPLRPLCSEDAAAVGREHSARHRGNRAAASAERRRPRRDGHGGDHRNGHAVRALRQRRHQPSSVRDAQRGGCRSRGPRLRGLPLELSGVTMSPSDPPARVDHDRSAGTRAPGMSAVQTAVAEIVDGGFDAECDFLASLVKIPTDNPPGDCAAHAARARVLLEALGFAVEAHPVPVDSVRAAGMIAVTNLIARQRFGKDGPCVALNAHGDVVPPGLGWTRDPYGAEIVSDPTHGPTMYGRGVAVSKSDFATYTYALRALQELASNGHAINGSVELHLTYDEEVGGEIGPRWLLAQGLSRPDYAICAGF